MRDHQTSRYCADPQAIEAMRRDGLGWGHDIECGSFLDAALPSRKGAFTRIIRKFIGKS